MLPQDLPQRADQGLDLLAIPARFQSQHDPVSARPVYAQEAIGSAGQLHIPDIRPGRCKSLFIGPNGCDISQIVEAPNLDGRKIAKAVSAHSFAIDEMRGQRLARKPLVHHRKRPVNCPPVPDQGIALAQIGGDQPVAVSIGVFLNDLQVLGVFEVHRMSRIRSRCLVRSLDEEKSPCPLIDIFKGKPEAEAGTAGIRVDIVDVFVRLRGLIPVEEHRGMQDPIRCRMKARQGIAYVAGAQKVEVAFEALKTFLRLGGRPDELLQWEVVCRVKSTLRNHLSLLLA